MNRRTPMASLALFTAAVMGTVLATPQAVAVPAPAGDVSVTAAADALAAGNTAALFKSADDVMIREAVTAGTHGLNYVSYQRTYRGLRVVGGDAVIVTDASGKVLNTAVAQDQVISVGTSPSINAAQAAATARAQLATVQTASAPELVVLAWGTPRLAWEVKLTGAKADGAESVPTVYVDAATGQGRRQRRPGPARHRQRLLQRQRHHQHLRLGHLVVDAGLDPARHPLRRPERHHVHRHR